MTNHFPSPCFSAMEPAASLTSVRVRRRNITASPSGKRGDLTDQGEPQAMQAAPAIEIPIPLEVPPPPAAAMAAPPPAPEPLVIASEMPAPAPAPAPMEALMLTRDTVTPVEPLIRETPAPAEPLILTRDTATPAEPLIREARIPAEPLIIARETPAPEPVIVAQETPALATEPLIIARETPAPLPTQEPLFVSRDMPAPAAMAPTAPALAPVEPLVLTQPALEERLAHLDAPKPAPAPVLVTPTPSLPVAAEREAVLPLAEVMLPELAAVPPPSEPFKPEPEAWNDAWTKHEEAAPIEASVRAPEPAPAPIPLPAPAPEPETKIEPSLFLVPRAVETEADDEPKFKPLSEPKLSIPMAAGPKAVIDLMSMDPPLAEPIPAPMPAPTPAPAPVASEAAAVPPEAANGAATGSAGADDILEYWDALRGAQDLPALKDLDRGRVAATWPNTVLLAFPTLEEPARITRVGDNNGDVEYTAMVTDWILTRGRNSAKRGQPMEEEQRFPVSGGGRARYRLLMLPFAGDDGGAKSEHVLCHITRAQDRSAVDSFKRWLAS